MSTGTSNDDRSALVAAVNQTEKVMSMAQSKYREAVRKLQDFDLERASTAGETIETALSLDPTGPENRLGLKYLRERLSSDWKDSYLTFPGSMLIHVHQWTVQVAIPHNASMDRIRATAAAIEEIIPFVLPGGFASTGKPYLADVRAIVIRENDISGHHTWCLGLKGDEWRIFDAKRYHDDPHYTGDLIGALCVIAKQFYRSE